MFLHNFSKSHAGPAPTAGVVHAIRTCVVQTGGEGRTFYVKGVLRGLVGWGGGNMVGGMGGGAIFIETLPRGRSDVFGR